MSRTWRRRTTGMAVALAIATVQAASGVARADTPIPRVQGPIPETATSYPFGAADHQRVPEDLAQVGYVEDEYLVSGRANVYDWPAPGPAVVRTPDVPYTTRVLIRRPANRARFSGRVVVEALNPSNLFDLNIGWGLAHKQMVRAGDVWVGITEKPVSIDALKTFDPQRYGTLSMANPLPPTDPRNCTTQSTIIPGDSSQAGENGLAYDMSSQVGAWLRSGARTNPLNYGEKGRRNGPSPLVKELYGFGYSQTGSMLYTYINAIQPLTLQQDGGRRIFDGYIVAVAGGRFIGLAPINQCSPVPPQGDPRYQLKGAGVPIIHIMSQSDYLIGINSRQPDVDAYPDQFRHYEMAGAAHATPDELNSAAAPADIVKAGRVPPPACNEGPRSRFPSSIFFDAALRNLDLWARKGVAPPRAQPILVRDGAPVLDQYGNVIGGLRSPYLDVPTSTWFGSSTGASFCSIVGHEVPFDAATLRALYPTHEDYVRAVAQDVADLVARRFITAYDGQALIEEAIRADVPPAAPAG